MPTAPQSGWSDGMNFWIVGFALLAVGIGIPIAYALYEFVLASIPWYWRLSVICILAGVLVLMGAAVRERLSEETPQQKV